MSEPTSNPFPDDPGEAALSDVALHTVLEFIQEAIQLFDHGGRLVLANPKAIRLFGRQESASPRHDQIYGNCLLENGHHLQPDELPVARVLSTGEPIDNMLLSLRRGDDTARWLRVSARPIPADKHGLYGVAVTATDITDLIEHGQRLEHLASYDALTQLPNRLLLAERIRMSLARGRRMGEMVAVCMLDLDGFKPVNDRLGHKAGDQLLREVAIRMQESVRGDDTVARLGGDEFAILLCGIRRIGEIEQGLTRVLNWVGQPYQIAGQTVQISASAGVALFPGDGSDPDLLLGHADAALYQAKEAGKNRYRFFDHKLDIRLQANRGLLRKIGKAVSNQEFVLYYQPMVNCLSGRVDGVEALIRWRHPVLGLLAPAEFLPLVNQDDLGISLGEWVIGEALRQIAAWRAEGIELDVSVNISARQLHQADFADRLAALIAGQPPEVGCHLRIEIAESTAMADVGATAEALRKCQKNGITVTLDNFGIGFASLQHLKRLITDTLKIDQSFVKNMLQTPEDLAIVGGVIGFAAPFGCRVVAQGAETIEHLLILLELGCEVIQGYSLARPMPADRLTTWLKGFQPDPRWRLASVPRPSRDHFELLLAEAHHRAWIGHILAQLRLARDDKPVLCAPACPFDVWLDEQGRKRFPAQPEFQDIERLHHAMHGQIGQVIADYGAGNLDQAQAGERQLLARHSDILALLRALRRRIGCKPPARPPAAPEENTP